MSELVINHLAIRSPDATATRDFFKKTLALIEGPRPDFPFPGFWLYKEDSDLSSYLNAVIHIVAIDPLVLHPSKYQNNLDLLKLLCFRLDDILQTLDLVIANLHLNLNRLTHHQIQY